MALRHTARRTTELITIIEHKDCSVEKVDYLNYLHSKKRARVAQSV
jgi:hypothetical protein